MNSDEFLDGLPPVMLSRPDRDALAEQMQGFERATKRSLPSRGFVAVRVDGKSFSSYTRGLVKPFDEVFADDMDRAAFALMNGLHGAVGAFIVSDEISVILTDLMSDVAQPVYSWEEAKLISLTAAIATAAFNAHRDPHHPGLFDSRVFSLPDAKAVQQYLGYRQGDGVRNAISTMGRLQYGKTLIRGVSANSMRDMLEGDGLRIPSRHSLGRFIYRVEEERAVTFIHSQTGKEETVDAVSFIPRLFPAPFFTETSPSDWLPPLVSQ